MCIKRNFGPKLPHIFNYTTVCAQYVQHFPTCTYHSKRHSCTEAEAVELRNEGVCTRNVYAHCTIILCATRHHRWSKITHIPKHSRAFEVIRLGPKITSCTCNTMRNVLINAIPVSSLKSNGTVVTPRACTRGKAIVFFCHEIQASRWSIKGTKLSEMAKNCLPSGS